MKLTIVSVAYPLAPVSTHTSGGAEQVLAMLDRALVRAGHHSIVVASEDSQVSGLLVPTPKPRGPLDEGTRRAAHAEHRKAIVGAVARWPIDLVHMHGYDFNSYLPPEGVPALATLHCPPAWYAPEAFFLTRPETYLHCVSATQRKACPVGAKLLPDIPNGVAVDEFETKARKRNYALCLGRICPEKGFHLALDAAKCAGLPLGLAGELFLYEAHARYFREEVQPRLDRHRRYLGPAGFDRKRRLLGSARCLLVASLVPETSSLVAMEAMACSTPVIAFPAGAIAEIVDHGRTGFLVESVKEMAGAMHQVVSLDPETCRRTARERFCSDRMFTRYLDLYRGLRLRRAYSAA